LKGPVNMNVKADQGRNVLTENISAADHVDNSLWSWHLDLGYPSKGVPDSNPLSYLSWTYSERESFYICQQGWYRETIASSLFWEGAFSYLKGG